MGNIVASSLKKCPQCTGSAPSTGSAASDNDSSDARASIRSRPETIEDGFGCMAKGGSDASGELSFVQSIA